jgi:hypothetical protein
VFGLEVHEPKLKHDVYARAPNTGAANKVLTEMKSLEAIKNNSNLQ